MVDSTTPTSIIAEVQEVIESYGSKFFSTGETIEEELIFTYKLLKYLNQSSMHVTRYGQSYGGRQYQDITRNFATRVILPFANHIEDYLTDIAIDMGYYEEAKFMININGGQAQVNISNDHSTGRIKKEHPKKGFLKTAWTGIETTIQKIPDAVQLVDNLHKLGTIVGPYLT